MVSWGLASLVIIGSNTHADNDVALGLLGFGGQLATGILRIFKGCRTG
jgi:hypothetical protein